MNSKKSLLSLVALAVIGAFIFSLFTIHSSVSFVLGVAFTAVILLRLNNTEQEASSDASSEDLSQATKTLYVGNLPYKANESHVRDLFAKYGEVFAVRLMKDKRTGKRRGFGFVVVSASHAQTAIDALNETDYMQRTLKVRIANDPKHPEEEMDE